MTPFIYLADIASRRVTAILDWDNAKYLKLHFIGHLFGCMTRDGWEDVEDREALESMTDSSSVCFYRDLMRTT